MPAPASIVAAVATALLATGAGCATPLTCPAKGGSPWRELTSDHFRLRTDLEPDDAEATVRALEESRAVMSAVVWPGSPQPQTRTDVIAFQSRTDLRELTGSEFVGGQWLQKGPFTGTLVTAGPPDLDGLRTLAHEVAHDLAFWHVPLQPLWYAEGLATYLETAGYDRARRVARVGEPSLARQRELVAMGALPARVLLGAGATGSGLPAVRFEATAWLLVHYLMNHRSAEFVRLQARLNALAPAAQAWAAELPDLTPDDLDLELERYLAYGRYSVDELRIDLPQFSATTRLLSDAEVHGVYAFLFSAVRPDGEPPRLDRAREQVNESLAADGGALDALAVSFYVLDPQGKAPAARSELARRAVAAHPESWLAWVMAADAAIDNDARRAALGRALALSANQPQVLVRQALLEASQQRWREAIVFTTRALRNRSAGTALYLTHLEALAHTGYCREGAALAATLPAQLHPALAAEVVRNWPHFQEVCAQEAAAREAREAREPK